VGASTYFPVGNFDTYQLIINTLTNTGFITFLLVALLRNTQEWGEQALQHKLDAMADGLTDLMNHFAANDDPERREAEEDLTGDIEDLWAAVGLEGKM
jgi:low affinity Fe/Cu permease